MTKSQMTKAAQGDDEARAKLIQQLQGADEDTIIALVENLIAAAERNAAADIRIDLVAEGYGEAAELVESNYL